MPTGYTAFLLEHPEATLADFAWRCARGMSLCITQRDDPYDAAIVMEEKPSGFYEERLSEARNERMKVADMTDAEWDEESRRQREERRKNFLEYRRGCRAENDALNAMIAKVTNWCPPAEMRGMRDFMLNQLLISLNPLDESVDREISADLSPISRADKLNQLAGEIARYERHVAEERDAVFRRNRYKAMLLESVGEPALVKLDRQS